MSNKCAKCGASIDPEVKLCSACASPAVRQAVTEHVSPISTSRGHALPSGPQVCQIIESTPVLPCAVAWVAKTWNTPPSRTQLLGDGVHDSPDQLQSAYSLACLGASRLGIPMPDIFVKQDPTSNAYTLRMYWVGFPRSIVAQTGLWKRRMMAMSLQLRRASCVHCRKNGSRESLQRLVA